ncbi:MAG: histidine kinase dimerization/phospho-acceptor domain-containing protein [Faecalibacterium sp.]
MKAGHSLAAESARMLLMAGLICVLLFLGLQFALREGVYFYFSQPEAQEKEVLRQAQTFQKYITARNISSTDAGALTRWVEKHRFTLLEVYRDGTLIYTSVSRGDWEMRKGDNQQPHFQRLPYYSVEFADGPAQVMFYCNASALYYAWGSGIFLVVCVALFLALFLMGCRRIVRYLSLLISEIQAMEGGDLEHPITMQGQNELTVLAQCLDSMRLTLRRQQQQEAEAEAQMKTLITEMSHDLRTPLTTMLLYTEILRKHTYETDAQRDGYLAVLDTKAHQLKQLSDNLFEYALVTRDTAVALDAPAHFSQIFEEPLAELVDTLQQRGFSCVLELGSEDRLLQVNALYIRRILDNIGSNLLKYADPSQPILVRYLRENERVGLCFENRTLPCRTEKKSAHVGLVSIQTMMEKMHAESHVEQKPNTFCITLLFPVRQSG